MTAWPDEISDLILRTFGDDSRKAYGQISTVAPDGQPSVRTVHIHSIQQPLDALVASCNTKSEKWNNLKKNPQIAGCFWDAENQVQIRFSGVTDLISEGSHDFSDLLQTMWMKMREEVRLTYLLDEKGQPMDTAKPNLDVSKHSKNHGILLISPTRWDVFHNNPKSYRLGKRKIFDLTKKEWKSKEVTSLHER